MIFVVRIICKKIFDMNDIKVFLDNPYPNVVFLEHALLVKILIKQMVLYVVLLHWKARFSYNGK